MTIPRILAAITSAAVLCDFVPALAQTAQQPAPAAPGTPDYMTLALGQKYFAEIKTQAQIIAYEAEIAQLKQELAAAKAAASKSEAAPKAAAAAPKTEQSPPH